MQVFVMVGSLPNCSPRLSMRRFWSSQLLLFLTLDPSSVAQSLACRDIHIHLGFRFEKGLGGRGVENSACRFHCYSSATAR